MASEKQLVTVKTGEPYQPVRIYYQVLKQKTVLGALQKLKCVEYDSDLDRWNWLYEAEAKKLRFARSYSSLGADDKPLILGYFTFRSADLMLLDLRSFERAAQAVEFFDKRINRYAANPTHMRLINRCFSMEEMPNRQIHPSLDPFFDCDNVPCLALEMQRDLDQIAATYANDLEAKDEAIKAYMDQQMGKPHPEIEELIIYPDKMDRLSLPMVLQMRQIEAFEHWRGNFTFRATDLIQQWVEATASEFADELIDDPEAELEAELIEAAEDLAAEPKQLPSDSPPSDTMPGQAESTS